MGILVATHEVSQLLLESEDDVPMAPVVGVA